MPIHNLIVADDDQLSREILKHFLSLLPQFSICGEASNGEELIGKVMTQQPDLILLDINMPQMDGIDAIKTILKINPHAKFIFITGHDNYAVEAFSLAAIDYIVKPVERSRLYAAMEKAAKILSMPTEKASNPKLVIKSRRSFHYVPLDDIIFIEKVDRKAIIHTLDASFQSSDTLEMILTKLDNRFINTHRSYIINVEHLANITPVDETFMVSFHNYDKKAIISKHKMAKTQEVIQSYIK
jgi:two-component system, LytTR family, response regulator